MKYVFGAIIGQDKDNGGYWAEVPDLPGCYGQGDTFIEAYRMSHCTMVTVESVEIIRIGKDMETRY